MERGEFLGLLLGYPAQWTRLQANERPCLENKQAMHGSQGMTELSSDLHMPTFTYVYLHMCERTHTHKDDTKYSHIFMKYCKQRRRCCVTQAPTSTDTACTEFLGNSKRQKERKRIPVKLCCMSGSWRNWGTRNLLELHQHHTAYACGKLASIIR